MHIFPFIFSIRSDFSLLTVELAEDVDPEGLDVARECLEEAFKLSQTSTDDQIPHGLMANLFKNYFSLDKQSESTATPNPEPEGITSRKNTSNDDRLKASKVCFSYLHIVWLHNW